MPSSIFDIIGPTMVGPSSSHTVGALRIARIAGTLKGSFSSVKVLLHGSFAHTGGGHGTDRAILAGLLRLGVNDERIKDAEKYCTGVPWKYSFQKADLGQAKHPNTARLVFDEVMKGEFAVEGESIGGGEIRITEVNGIPLEASFAHPTLIIKHHDAPGSLAKVLTVISGQNANVSHVSVWPEQKRKMAVAIIELDDALSKDTVQKINSLQNVSWASYVEIDWTGFA